MEQKDDGVELMINDSKYKHKPLDSFEDSAFLPKLFSDLYKELGFKKPTPVQAHCIPLFMDQKDLVGVAQTGSGKTLSFIIPSISAILDEKSHIKEKNIKHNNSSLPMVVVMAPTRELTLQIHRAAMPFARKADVQISAVYGGAPYKQMIEDVSRGVDIVVATPGRLIDFVEKGYLDLRKVFIFVLDEADRMLDMGFLPQIKNVLESIGEERQSVMFSATWPQEVKSLAREVFTAKESEFAKVIVGGRGLTLNKNIQQQVVVLEQDEDKRSELKAVLRKETISETYKVLIFVRRKVDTETVSSNLNNEGYRSVCIHGDKKQRERNRVLHEFEGRVNIMVATDVASRGLDIKEIRLVINYDFPGTIEDYIHRIGRTGRAGRRGKACSFITGSDSRHKENLIELLEKAGQHVSEDLRNMRGGRRGKYSGRDRNRSRYQRRDEDRGDWRASSTYKKRRLSPDRKSSFYRREKSGYRGRDRRTRDHNNQSHHKKRRRNSSRDSLSSGSDGRGDKKEVFKPSKDYWTENRVNQEKIVW